jgi:YHS domain-containing protein
MKTLVVSLSLLLLACVNVSAQKSQIFVSDGVAIKGYDAVAFFTESKPVMGDKKFSYSWMGADWHFANQGDLDAFKASPEKYAPQYGGYCAYGTSQGHKAPTKPAETWSVIDGKLYFNYNKDVKAMFDKDQKGYIMKADTQWPKIKDSE